LESGTLWHSGAAQKIALQCPESKVRYINAVILSERSESKDLHFPQDGCSSVLRKCATNFEFTTLEARFLKKRRG
jgi:hypothetical protein